MSKIGYVMAYREGLNNYGTSLQGYALLKKLLELGHTVEIIHYIKQPSVLDKVKWVINSFRSGMGIKTIKKYIPHHYSKEHINNIKLRTIAVDSYKKSKLMSSFVDYKGYKALCEGSNKYDIILVGSDQVWTPLGLPSKFYNLLFVDDNVRKVAYASSFGVQEIPDFQKKSTGKYLDRFYAIGVREQRAKEIVESLSRNRAQVVADPTILLSREEWDEEIKGCTNYSREPYIFCYLISENEEARIKAMELSRQKGIKTVCIRHLERYRDIDEEYGDEAPYNLDPNGFIRMIKDASYVVTDSFHCTVFSIIYHKHFLTFYRSKTGRTSRNSRIDSLFSTLSINPARLYSIGGLCGIDSYVDWVIIDRELLSFKNSSLDWLRQSLD